ncbi:MAG: hypothetical protein JW910_16185, partial [Anaerolineae bacterium]|nr:hypothetical protein [Anaerolineae bacterium]
MSEALSQFLTAPGNFLYFLVVLGISFITLVMALGQRLRGGREERAAWRYALAACGLVLGWIALVIGILVGRTSGQPEAAIMPPLERA